MKRWRFFVAQAIWFFAAIFSGIAGAEGDGEMIPFLVLFAFMLSGFTLKWGSWKGKHSDEDITTGYDAHIIARVMATGLIWMTYLAGSVASVMEMAGWGVLLAIVLMIPAIVFTGLIWSWERISGLAKQGLYSRAEQIEKRKRSKVDSVLSSLSDADLRRLRERLSEVEDDEAQIFDHISDDGELVYRH